MVGILIVSHGKFAEGLVDAAQMVMGKQEKLESIGLQPNEGPENLKNKMMKKIEFLNQGKGVLVLVDLFGGTPGNTAAYMVEKNNVEVLTGINLPILLELLNLREIQNLDELIKSAKTIASEGFKVLSEVI